MLLGQVPGAQERHVDLGSYLLLFFPVMITLMVISIDDAWYATRSARPRSSRRGARSCGRSVASVPLAALLFMVQGVSESLKCWYQIRF
jgi:TRAP-type mannitol/chloroaromatic compound transport system permease small subunit